jgi:hypothetical protein
MAVLSVNEEHTCVAPIPDVFAGRDAIRHQKKEQGKQPCSENCVDPIFPKIEFDFD